MPPLVSPEDFDRLVAALSRIAEASEKTARGLERRAEAEQVGRDVLDRLTKVEVDAQWMRNLKTQSGSWDVTAVQAAALQLAAPKPPSEKKVTTIPPGAMLLARFFSTSVGRTLLTAAGGGVIGWVVRHLWRP